MKREKGFISIIALIIMSVLLPMVLYLGHISSLEYLILNASSNKTQSYYQSEGKIYLSLYDESYYLEMYSNIVDVFRRNNFSTKLKRVVLEDSDLYFGDNLKNVRLSFVDNNQNIEMNIVADSNINGVKTNLTSSGKIVNEIFETKYPALFPNLVSEEHREDLYKFLVHLNDNINIGNCNRPQTMFGTESRNFSQVILNNIGSNNYEIASTRENMIDPHIERFNKREVFIIARNNGNEKLSFHIGSPNSESNTVELSGVIFVEGDMIISSDFKFKGIIIVVDGEIVVNSNTKPNLQGLIIMNNISDEKIFKEIDIIRSRSMIYKYGTYLPGFLDPKITVIKGI